MNTLTRIQLILMSVTAWAIASACCFLLPEWSVIATEVPFVLLGIATLALAAASQERATRSAFAFSFTTVTAGILLAVNCINSELGIMLAAGGALSFFGHKNAFTRRFSQALIHVGLLMTTFDLGYIVWEKLAMASNWHIAATKSAMLLMSAAGIETTSVNGGFSADLQFSSQVINSDWGKLGGYFILVFPMALVSLASFRARRGLNLKFALAAFGTTAAYVVLRLAAALVISFSVHPQMDPFVLPDWVLLSFLPLPFMAAALLPCRSTKAEEAVAPSSDRMNRIRPYSWAAIGCGAALISLSANFFTMGEKAPGKILFDEAHSNWERADREFDQEYFGKGSTYNYAEFLELLKTRGEVLHHREGEITKATLEDVQVIILKTPTARYTARERRCILEHVERGAGLWLIGDHTNLYGMSTILNEFSKPAGIVFEPDSTFDFLSGGPTFYEEIGVPHPAARGVDGLAYQTSCSLRPLSLSVHPVLVGRRMTSEHADYGHRNFFANITTELHDRFGSFHQASASTYGHGKILVFSDSTVLSNFSIYASGITSLVHSSVDWLGHRAGFLDRHRAFVLVAGLVLLLAGMFLISTMRASTSWAYLIALISYVLVLSISGNAVPNDADRRRSDQMFQEMAIVEGASNFIETSFLEEAQGPGDRPLAAESISTFMNWSMRLGKVRPTITDTISRAIESKAQVIVLFEPDIEPTREEINALNTYVAQGGTLLLADDIRNARSSTAGMWAQSFGLKFGLVNEKFPVRRALADRRMPTSHRYPFISSLESVVDILRVAAPLEGDDAGMMERHKNLVVIEGRPLLLDHEGDVIMAERQHGAGKVVAFSASYSMTNAVLGGRYDPKPDAEKRRKYDAIFAVINACIEGDPE